MALVSRLGVVLGLDSAEFSAGLGKAESSLNKFSTFAKGAAVTAIAAIGYEFAQAARAAIDYADKIADVAKANEVSVATVLKLSDAMVVNGGEADATAKMFASFTNKIDEAAKGSKTAQDSFKQLGITVDDLGKLSQQELFDKAMKTLASPQMGDVISRNASAMDLFGKAVKGVDVKGLAQDYLSNENAFLKEEQAFMAINKAMDEMDKATAKTKQRMATDLQPILTGSVQFFDTLINGWTRLEQHINDAAKAHEKFVAKQQGVSTWKPAGLVGTPLTPAEASKLPGFTGSRKVEQTAEEKSAIEKAKNLNEALQGQLRTLTLQTNEIGKQKSKYEETKLLFAEGGRYHDLANSSLAKQVLTQAKLYDQVDLTHKGEEAIKKVLEEHSKLRDELNEKGRLAVEAVIEKRQQEKEDFDRKLDDLRILKERLDYEAQLVNLSDTQKQKALEYYDLRQKMIRVGQDEIGWTEKQTEAYQSAEQAVINSTESTKRAQNTFQAGWNNAWENFVEKSKDSASLGAEAFSSMASSMESAIDTFVRTGKLSFSSLAQSIISDLIRIQLRAQMSGLFGMIGGDSGGMISMLGSAPLGEAGTGSGLMGWFSGLFRANGGGVDANSPYIVGERGAELFVPNSSGTIIPNHSLSSTLGNQPQTVYNGTVIQNMNAIDTQSGIQFLAKNKSTIWAANQSAQRSLPMSR